MAKLLSWWSILTKIPAAIRWDDGDIDRRTMLIIVGRVAKSRYYDKYSKKQQCGCYAIGSHYTSYLNNCEEHMGWLWKRKGDH